MTTAIKPQTQTSIEDYLEGEQFGDIKHEYLAGQVVAMVGATRAHNKIAGALYACLLPAARHKACDLRLQEISRRPSLPNRESRNARTGRGP